MKIKTLLSTATLAWAASLSAAPLGVATAVQLRPDASSPVIVVLGAGTERPAPSAKAGPAPDGWVAVDLAGPFTGYVKNKDLSKQLDVVPGSSIYLGPKETSGVLAVFEKGDKAEITGLHGTWTQVRLEKTITGYLSIAPSIPAPAPAPIQSAPVAPAAVAPAPTSVSSSPGPVAPEGSASEAARIFEGKFVSSESFLYPHRPFPWQLNDPNGHRIAYVNLQSILLTDQVDNYAGHEVVVLGTLRPAKESRDLVIDVEAFHLK